MVISHLDVAYSKDHPHLTKMHSKTLNMKVDSQGSITTYDTPHNPT